jgi:hypothetical protein
MVDTRNGPKRNGRSTKHLCGLAGKCWRVFRCVHLKRLPRDYVGQKHTVLVKGWPYQPGTGGACELEERPGPGPDLDFGFNGRTILFTYFSYPGEEECP